MIEQYLNAHDVSLETVLTESREKRTDVKNMEVIQYPVTLLDSIGKKVRKDPSLVLYELLAMKNQEAVTRIDSREELAEAIKQRRPYIFIPAAIREAESELVHSVMAEKDTMGVELGSAGTANILAEIIYRFQMMFNSDSKEFKDLKSKLRRYHVRVQDQSGHLIYEKEQLY